MLQVTLELSNEDDKNFLLPLLQRLGIRYTLKEQLLNEETLKECRKIIEQSIEITDFNDFIKDFDASRKDRILPFRSE